MMQEMFKSDLFFASLCKGKHGVDWVEGVDEQIGDLVRDRLSQQLVQFLDLMKIMVKIAIYCPQGSGTLRQQLLISIY